jgi:hypothetical protein
MICYILFNLISDSNKYDKVIKSISMLIFQILVLSSKSIFDWV